LKNATTSCLSETADGSCPTFAFASVGIGGKIKQTNNPVPEKSSKKAIPAALERDGECKTTNSLFQMTYNAVGAFKVEDKVEDNIKTFTAAENPMKNAPTLSLPSLLLVSREPMKWTAAATHPTFTDHQFELGSSGHNAAVWSRVVVPGNEQITSVLPKFFEDLKPLRNCTIASAPQQRMEKTNSQKLIAKKRKARQKYMNEIPDVVFGVNSQKVHVPFWKIHVHTPAILLPVRMLIRVFENVPPSVTVGIVGFLVLCFFGAVVPWWMLYLFGYRVGFGKKHKQCGFSKFYVSLLVSLFAGVGVVQAVFTPEDGNYWDGPLKNAIASCLSETPDGSCPTFAASNDASGNPYGVIGVWDVSAVTSMENSKCTLSPLPLCGHGPRRLPLWCVVEYICDNSRFVGSQVSHVFFFFSFVV